MNVKIIKISRFCTDDGPGIRTTVFLKGCPLHCIWCHNVESQNKELELLFDINKCVNCNKCLSICEKNCFNFINNKRTYDKTNCTLCQKCVDSCPSKAIDVYGYNISIDDIIEEIKKDIMFYNSSNGGVTISGGEPLYNYKATIEILKRCKELGINTAIETSGFSSLEIFKEVVSFCDFVLFDIKETNYDNHIKYTGVSLKNILTNLKYLNNSKTPYILRCPIIPSINDRKEHFDKLNTLIDYNLDYFKGIEVMPYHKLGNYKYELLGKEYLLKDINEPSEEMINKWNSYLLYRYK